MTASTALYPVADIRAIEQAAMPDLPPGALMQRAGQSAAKLALSLLPPAQRNAILVLAGPGNNGGDALEAGYQLAQAGLEVCIVMDVDHQKQSPDSRQALARAKSSTATFADLSFVPAIGSTEWALVIDGLFGIGQTRPIAGAQRTLVEAVNTLVCPVLALDVPSGLDADTGAIVGPDGVAICASHTITFIANKPGLHTNHGRDYAGLVYVETLEIENRYFNVAHAHLNQIALFSQSLQRRSQNTHKGSYGDVIVVGGAHGMGGAPILAARAAAQCGAGRVYAGFVEHAPLYDSSHPELMCRLAHELDFSTATLVVGPGLGTSRAAHDLLTQALAAHTQLVLDADALNLIAAEPSLAQKLSRRRESTLLTPHPLEAARLLATSSAAIQADRLESARELARRYNATIILKGSGTVIAQPDGEIVINTTGNPALATAGTGDVLAGLCGALLAQHWSARDASLAAVWLHGSAADTLVKQGIGPIGLGASELIPSIRSALNRLIEDHAPQRAR